MQQKKQATSKSSRSGPASEPGGPEPSTPSLERLLDALPVMWLVLVGSTYLVLALHPFMPVNRPVPGIAEAERAYWPLLLSLVSAAILRYFLLRTGGARRNEGDAPAAGQRRERA